jgi:hypothetical protein
MKQKFIFTHIIFIFLWTALSFLSASTIEIPQTQTDALANLRRIAALGYFPAQEKLVTFMAGYRELQEDKNVTTWLLERTAQKEDEKYYAVMDRLFSSPRYPYKKELKEFLESQAIQKKPIAQLHYGILFLNHATSLEEENEGLYWIDKASHTGNNPHAAQAFYRLGEIYEKRKADLQTIFLFFGGAASLGHSGGQLKIALMMREGLVPSEPSFDKKVNVYGQEWFSWQAYIKEAARKEHLGAMLELSICLYEGTGMDANPKDAFALLSTLVNKEYTPAKCYLAKCLYEGRYGIPQDKDHALKIAQEEAQKNNLEAIVLLSEWLLSPSKTQSAPVREYKYFTLYPDLENVFYKIGFIIGQERPTIFISRAYTDENPTLLRDLDHINLFLKLSGIRTIYDVNGDQDGLGYGHHTKAFMEDSIKDSQYVLILYTPAYLKRSRNATSGVSEEITHITRRIEKEKKEGKASLAFLIPVLMDGKPDESVPAILNNFLWIDGTRNSPAGFDFRYFMEEMLNLFVTRIFTNHPQLAFLKKEVTAYKDNQHKTTHIPTPEEIEKALTDISLPPPDVADFTQQQLSQLLLPQENDGKESVLSKDYALNETYLKAFDDFLSPVTDTSPKEWTSLITLWDSLKLSQKKVVMFKLMDYLFEHGTFKRFGQKQSCSYSLAYKTIDEKKRIFAFFEEMETLRHVVEEKSSNRSPLTNRLPVLKIKDKDKPHSVIEWEEMNVPKKSTEIQSSCSYLFYSLTFDLIPHT